MTDTQIFEPDGRAIPFVDEGEGPVKLVLIQEQGLAADVLGVVARSWLRKQVSMFCASATVRAQRMPRSMTASPMRSP